MAKKSAWLNLPCAFFSQMYFSIFFFPSYFSFLFILPSLSTLFYRETSYKVSLDEAILAPSKLIVIVKLSCSLYRLPKSWQCCLLIGRCHNGEFLKGKIFIMKLNMLKIKQLCQYFFNRFYIICPGTTFALVRKQRRKKHSSN